MKINVDFNKIVGKYNNRGFMGRIKEVKMATTIQDLEERVDALYNSILQMQLNLNPVIDKTDNTANKVDTITPTVITKQGYIDDTEVVFNDVPNGNVTVYVEDENGSFLNYSVARVTDMITVSFDKPLEYTAKVTLSII